MRDNKDQYEVCFETDYPLEVRTIEATSEQAAVKNFIATDTKLRELVLARHVTERRWHRYRYCGPRSTDYSRVKDSPDADTAEPTSPEIDERRRDLDVTNDEIDRIQTVWGVIHDLHPEGQDRLLVWLQSKIRSGRNNLGATITFRTSD